MQHDMRLSVLSPHTRSVAITTGTSIYHRQCPVLGGSPRKFLRTIMTLRHIFSHYHEQLITTINVITITAVHQRPSPVPGGKPRKFSRLWNYQDLLSFCTPLLPPQPPHMTGFTISSSPTTRQQHHPLRVLGGGPLEFPGQ